MWMVIYRQNDDLRMDTKHYGPFTSEAEAYEYHCKLPAIGYYDEELHEGQHGCKYIEMLIPPTK